MLFADLFSVPSAHSKPKGRIAKRCCLQRLKVPHCVHNGRHSRHYFPRHRQRTWALTSTFNRDNILLQRIEWPNFINERMYLLRRKNGVVITCNSGSFLSSQCYSPFGHWNTAKASPKEQNFLTDNRSFMVYELVGRHSPMRICALDRDTAWRHGYTPTTRYRRYLWWYFLVHRLRRQCDVCW